MKNCIFCKIAKKEINSNIVYEDETVIAFLDVKPICDAHTLVIPKEHYETVFDIPNDTLAHMYEVAEKLFEKTKKVTTFNGGTMSFNVGHMQEVKHAHMHIMPNYHVRPKKEIEEIHKLLTEK